NPVGHGLRPATCVASYHSRIHASRPRIQLLDQKLEPEVVPLRDAEALVAVGKWLVAPAASITAALVPCDQFVAYGDHRHLHCRASPLRACQSFGLRQHALADAGCLPGRLDREHAEVTTAALLL